MEQVGEMMAQLRGDRDALMEAKGSLEAQLKLERESSGAAHEQAVNEISRRCQELEDKMTNDRETHRQALDEARDKHVEQKTTLETDLRAKQEQFETADRALTALREEMEEKVSHHSAE